MEKEDQPLNANANPLPNHRGEGNTYVNMVKEEDRQSIINFKKVKTPTKVIFEVLMKTNIIKIVSPELGL